MSSGRQRIAQRNGHPESVTEWAFMAAIEQEGIPGLVSLSLLRLLFFCSAASDFPKATPVLGSRSQCCPTVCQSSDTFAWN